MIEFRQGDILRSSADIICHQVNCQGVMGSGLAKQVRQENPFLFQTYRKLCQDNKGNLLGTVCIVPVDRDINKPSSEQQLIANCFGQNNYGRNARYTDYAALRSSLSCVRNCAIREGKNNIAIPYKMGSGFGGGDWNVVYGIIREIFEEQTTLNVTIWRLV